MSSSNEMQVNKYASNLLAGFFRTREDGRPYTVADFPATWYAAVKSDGALGWDHFKPEIKELTRKQIAQRPTLAQWNMFRTKYDTTVREKLTTVPSLESAGVQSGRMMEWQGTNLVIGTDSYQTVPIVHDSTVAMSKSDEYVTAVAAMLLKNDDGAVVPTINPAVIEKGPLSVLLTKESYLEYAYSIGPMVADVGARGKGDQFQRSLYAGIAAAPASTRTALRHQTYKLYAKAKITVNQRTQQITWNNANVNFTAEKGMDKLIYQNDMGNPQATFVPKLLPDTLKGATIALNPDTVKKEKFSSAALADYITSHFPAPLIKYFGLRLACDKGQRLFLQLRPFLDNAVVVNPGAVLRQWMVANNLESSIRTTKSAFMVGDFEDDDIQLVNYNYEKGTTLSQVKDENGKEVPHEVYFYGKVALDSKFFSQFKIVCYEPSPSGNWVYCPAAMTLNLPEKWNGLPLQVITGGMQMLSVLSGMIKRLTTAVFAGNYSPQAAYYEQLKYPVQRKEYAVVDLMDTSIALASRTGVKGVTATEGAISFLPEEIGLVDDIRIEPEGPKKARTAAPMPRLLPPTPEQDEMSVPGTIVQGWSNFDFLGDYASEMFVIPCEHLVAVAGQNEAYLYDGMTWYALFDIMDGSKVVVTEGVFKTMLVQAMDNN